MKFLASVFPGMLLGGFISGVFEQVFANPRITPQYTQCPRTNR
jgi:hypothetical protein